MDYLTWGAMSEAYHKLKTKPKTSAKLKKALQVMEQPATGMDRQGCKRFPK